jgi:hypothetical protein
MSDNLHTIFSGSECPPHSVLHAYFLRTLTEDEMHRVEQHLVDCEMCSDELEGLSRMKDPGELDLIVEELSEKIGRKRGKILGMSRNYALMAAAAILFIIIGSVVVVRLLTHPQEQDLMSLSMEMPSEPSETAPAAPSASPPQPLSTTPKQTEKDTRATPATRPESPVVSEVKNPMAIAGITRADTIETKALALVREEEPAGAIATATVADSTAANEVIVEYQVPHVIQADAKKAAAEKDAGQGMRGSKDVSIMEIAMQEFTAGNYNRAKVFFEQVTSNEPNNYKAVYHLAYCYYMEMQYKKASRMLAPILKDAKNDYFKEATALSDTLKSGQKQVNP